MFHKLKQLDDFNFGKHNPTYKSKNLMKNKTNYYLI